MIKTYPSFVVLIATLTFGNLSAFGADPALPLTQSNLSQTSLVVNVNGANITTNHYDLWIEGSNGADVGNMLEQAFAQWKAFFGAEPTGRLSGKFFLTDASLAAGMKADGLQYSSVMLPGVGGYYHPQNRTFYIRSQPSAFYTRMLILHEATHQFQRQSVAITFGPQKFWYVEGLAEYFGMHSWDGTRLLTGVIPAISLEDYPAKALEEFDLRGRNLASLIGNREDWSRKSAWGIVSWLIDERPEGAKILFGQLNRNHSPVDTWTNVFGPLGESDASAYRDWLTRHQQPWKEYWRAFDQRGDTLMGSSDVNGLAVLKADQRHSDRLVVSLEPIDGSLRAGLVVGFADIQHFVVVQLLSNREVWAFRKTPAGWERLPSARAPSASLDRAQGLDILEAHPAAAGGWRVIVNGVEVITVPDVGLVGLNVDNCTVAFRVIEPAIDTYPSPNRMKYLSTKYIPTASAPINDKKSPTRTVSGSQPSTTPSDCDFCPEMVVIPAGLFAMGETGSTHQVKMKRFEIGRTEITQSQWHTVMGMNPSANSECGGTCPVDMVNWGDVQDFIIRINKRTGKLYRLPSEAEWEYACRAGERHRFCGSDLLDTVGWYGAFSNGNSEKKPSPVAKKRPNAWGVYDMSGGVWEWVQDCWNSSFAGAPTDGRAWISGDCTRRGVRGGSWENEAVWGLAGNRYKLLAGYRGRNVGFRLVRELQ